MELRDEDFKPADPNLFDKTITTLSASLASQTSLSTGRSVEAGHRPFHSELEDSTDILQDGDTSICSSFGSSGRLDGVSGLEGCILAGSDAPGFTQVPQVHGGREGVPIQGSLFRSFHCSTGLYQGHGSCVSYSSQDGGTALPVPRRLVASGFLRRAGSPCSEDSTPALQVSRDCRQLGEVSGDSDSTDGLSGSHPGLNYFQGFCPEESREASLNWRRILVLHQSASVILARAFRSAVLNDPTRAWGSSPHEVSPACSAETMGSCRSVAAGRVVSSDSSRSFLVARPRSLGAWHFSGAGVPSARIVVRRLGRGLGGSLRRTGRFWPLGSRRGRALDQCPRALGNRESSPVVCSTSRRFLGGGLCRQLDRHLLSEEPRRDSLFLSELHRSEDSPLGGGSSCGDFPAVHHGETQCPSGRSFSPKPNLGLRVDGEAGGLQGSVQEMAGVERPFCNISKSQMFDIFFSLPRSQCSGDGCPSKLEWVAGVCLSSLVTHSGGFEEAPVVLWGPADHHSSVLASEAVISGSSRSGGRRSGRSSTVQGPSASASLPSVPSGSVQAVSSCLETIKRFTRADGFSKHVAQQVSLACRPSSRAGYQSKWLVFRQWCRSEGHSISRPSLSKIADFLFWLWRSRQLSVSSIMGYHSMLSAVFKSILPEISSSPVLHDLLRSFQVEAPIREVRPPAWDLPTMNYLRSSSFEPLYTISLRDLTRKTLFLISLATAKRVGELQALSRRVSFSSSSAGLSYVPEFVTKTESAICPLPRSFEVKSLGDFVACLPEDLLLCFVQSLSAYLDRTSGLVNRPRCLFVSSKCPSRAMSKNCISYMLREVIVQSGASSQSGQVPRALSIRGIAFSVTGLFGVFWRRPLGVRTQGFYIFLFAGFIL